MSEIVDLKSKTVSENYFTKLNSIDVSDHTEEKNGLTYLSWAWAWTKVKELFPDANYKIYERADGCIYWTDGKTCWVKTGVTINNIEHIEYLPVMDYKNKSIPLNAVTSFDVNKTIQRSLTKACARHGLGLYIYAGEDLPEVVMEQRTKLDETISNIDKTIANLLKENIVDKNVIATTVKEHFIVNGKPSANYKAIKEQSIADKVLEALSNYYKK